MIQIGLGSRPHLGGKKHDGADFD